jgi:hypothetical protein
MAEMVQQAKMLSRMPKCAVVTFELRKDYASAATPMPIVWLKCRDCRMTGECHARMRQFLN